MNVATDQARTSSAPDDVLVQIEDLQVHFPIHGGFMGRQTGAVQAVDGVSLQIRRGETLGLVGESGCGKSTLSRAVLQLIKPTGGKVILDGRELTGLSGQRLRPLRRRMQMIFQIPTAR